MRIKAAERQHDAPLALAVAYSSYSFSRKCLSAATIASRRGSRRSNCASAISQLPLISMGMPSECAG
eukprot:Gb_37748 [translate_table: standard]